MAFALVFGILFLIYMKPIADWLEKKATEFFYKEPRGGYREMVIKAGTFFVEHWYMTYLTGALMVISSVFAIQDLWSWSDWLLPVPFIIFGAMFMLLGLEIRRRAKDKPRM